MIASWRVFLHWVEFMSLDSYGHNGSKFAFGTLFVLSFVLHHASWSVANDAESVHTFISGVYPHLTVYGIYSQNGAHLKSGHDECGIGAVVPWADKLWMVNYAPHQPHGSEHKLYSVDSDLQMTIHPESVGGTPAGRMIHHESNQLLISHYVISADGKVRVIPIEKMPIRVTAITRHLVDPANMVYYVDMEGSIWEANVHTLDVNQLFKKPVPGWHGKGGYVSQGRLVVSNNGELAAGNYDDLLVGGKPQSAEERGVLAEFNGKQWNVVERRQFTDVTGPRGLAGGSDDTDPIWAIGWDRRSLRLKLLDHGKWHTFLLPKAALCNDAIHGWYTEWPRIREITEGRWMMDMHGMFFDFPKTFSSENTAGLKPIGSHLRYVPDFCDWNGKLVLASDETSIQGNPLAGQPQTNLWFGSYEDLKSWGPASGYGGPWIEDDVKAHIPSDPFLVAGFDRRVLHLAVGKQAGQETALDLRTLDQLPMREIPQRLSTLPMVRVSRGDWTKPAPGYSLMVDHAVTIYLAVDSRGNPKLDSEWTLTDMAIRWGDEHKDDVYMRRFEAGRIDIPANLTEHQPGSFGLPHTTFVQADSPETHVTATMPASFTRKPAAKHIEGDEIEAVKFTIEIDRKGNGQWVAHQDLTVPSYGYVSLLLPHDFDATWLRLRTDRDCTATAFLHQTTKHFADGGKNAALFESLAEVDDADAIHAHIYPSKLNRNLKVFASGDRCFDFTKSGFHFESVEFDSKIASLLEVTPAFTVDAASVIIESEGRRFRLPIGDVAYNKPFTSGWPRAIREVESERNLANIHGTFYEVPLIANGRPPAFDLMRPVASHHKQISDFCTWNGLLVLSGVRADMNADGHLFANSTQKLGLWFGAIDDLWKFGKPVGRGGPWLDTRVIAETPSDAFLMTGYDRKSVEITSDKNTNVVIEVDFDHQSGWHAYDVVALKAGEPYHHRFDERFNAHWIRFIVKDNCTATAQMTYE